jgi:hypothetical protein
MGQAKTKTLCSYRRQRVRGADFLEASPVASALGIRLGATPRGQDHCKGDEKRMAPSVTFSNDPTILFRLPGQMT